MTEDADVVLLGMGTLSTPVKVAIRKMRQEGKKVGFVRMRWFRPFAAEELAECLSRFKAVGVIDRDFSLGSPYPQRSARHGSAGGHVQQRQTSAGFGLYLRPRRARGFGAGCREDDGNRVRRGRRKNAAADAVDWSSRITNFLLAPPLAARRS